MTEITYNGEKFIDIHKRYVGLMDKFNELQETDNTLENFEAIIDVLYSFIRYVNRDIDIPHIEKEKIIAYTNKCSEFIDKNPSLDKIRLYTSICLKSGCIPDGKCIDDLKFVQKLEETYNKYQIVLELKDDIESKMIGLDFLLIIIANESYTDHLDSSYVTKIFDIVTDFAGLLVINNGETDFASPLYLSLNE
jgi:hypothetical protein